MAPARRRRPARRPGRAGFPPQPSSADHVRGDSDPQRTHFLLEPGRKLRELLAHLQAPTGSRPPVSPERSAPACDLKPSLCVTQMIVRAHDQALPQAFLQIRCQRRNLNRAPLCRHSDIAILAPMTLLRQTYLHQIVSGLRADVLPADVAAPPRAEASRSASVVRKAESSTSTTIEECEDGLRRARADLEVADVGR